MVERGWKKIDVFRSEVGQEYDIHLSTMTGEFRAEVAGEEFKSKDLKSLKEKIEQRLGDAAKIEWKAVIDVHHYRYEETDVNPSFTITRLFVGETEDGALLRREWKDGKPDGEPGNYRIDEGESIIPYTDENWKTLKDVEKLLLLVAGQMDRFFKTKKAIDLFFKEVKRRGVRQVIFNP